MASTPPSSLPPPEILLGTNWVRITYADPVSAAKAVGTNGQIIVGAYMIGVVYASQGSEASASSTEMDVDSSSTNGGRRREEVSGSSANGVPGKASGERKMNVITGEQNIFAKKDMQRPGTDQHLGWGSWAWNIVAGEGEKKENVPSVPDRVGADGVVAGGGQSSIVAKTLRGLSETIFGF